MVGFSHYAHSCRYRPGGKATYEYPKLGVGIPGSLYNRSFIQVMIYCIPYKIRNGI